MCGIAGFLYRDSSRPALLDELKPMLDRIVHRGPDDWGHYADGPMSFGMRRLSIIDLSGGHQPIHNEDETVWTVLNGELYNFLELRPELEKKGHKFYTNADTEVIVHLWEEYGPDLVNHLRGMFALAVWDSRTKELLIARDRLGIKPLYYSETEDGLFYGSEMKSLLAHNAIEKRVDYQAIRSYLELQYVPAPMSVIQGIHKLMPGHLALWRDGHLAMREYWDALLQPDHERSYESFKEELEAELEDAVRMRLISDVPLGVFLSGGVDSSLIAAIMARQSSEPVKTFSIGFDYQEFDELRYARQIAEMYQTDHHEEVVSPDAIGLLPKLVHHYDEPFADSSAIPTYYVSKMAREHVTVVLSGDGGDELFSGYDRYRSMVRYQRINSMFGPLKQPFFSIAAKLAPLSLGKRDALRRLSLPLRDAYRDVVSYFSPMWLNEVAPNGPLSDASPNVDWDSYWENVSNEPFIAQLGYIDTKTYLPDDILTKVDRASMAVSLEARVPILDHKVVELAARIPFEYKLRGNTSKYILKDIMTPWAPKGFLERPKMGFGVPLVRWFRNELRDYVRDRLLSKKARERGLFDMRFVEQMIDHHQSGQVDIANLLWAMLFLEEWFCHHVDNEYETNST
jgi:asparagine synthase (glutamine-hydrolysing)